MTKEKHEEIEFVYTDIDVDDIRKRLEDAGAEFVFDKEFETVIFDYPDLRLNNAGGWIRLRRSDDEVTLAYKERVKSEDGGDDLGMKEIEFDVPEVNKTVEFFHAIGLITKIHQDKRRIRYMLDGVEVDIDFWPQIPPYMEIEGDSESDIDAVCSKLGLDPAKKRRVNQWVIYQENGIDLVEYSKMTFAEAIKK